MKTKLQLISLLRERGSAFMAALFCLLVVGMAAATLAAMSGSELKLHQRATNQMRAQRIARGGAERAMAWLMQNYQPATPTLPTDLESPTFPAPDDASACTVTLVPDNINNKIEIIAEATVNQNTATSRVLMERTPKEIDTDPTYLKGFGILVGGVFGGGGNLSILGTAALLIHSNTEIDITNVDKIIQDILASVGSVDIGKDKSGTPHTLKPGQSSVPIPTLKWDALKTEAQSLSFTYKGKAYQNYFASTAEFVDLFKSLKGSQLTVTGPLYVDGDVALSTNEFDININGGPLIVDGQVTYKGAGNSLFRITNPKVSGQVSPIAFAYEDGIFFVTGNGSNQVASYIYSTNGSVRMQGTSDMLLGGGLILGGDLTIGGTPDLNVVEIPGDLSLVFEGGKYKDGTYSEVKIIGWVE
ncbi:MAG: hypothetical protein WC789_13655 [Lentisphaeria bacterium]|jgi:hypothetical protein